MTWAICSAGCPLPSTHCLKKEESDKNRWTTCGNGMMTFQITLVRFSTYLFHKLLRSHYTTFLMCFTLHSQAGYILDRLFWKNCSWEKKLCNKISPWIITDLLCFELKAESADCIPRLAWPLCNVRHLLLQGLWNLTGLLATTHLPRWSTQLFQIHRHVSLVCTGGHAVPQNSCNKAAS